MWDSSESRFKQGGSAVKRAIASTVILGAVLGSSVSDAAGLPDFEKLVEEQADTVVSIAVLRESLQPTAAVNPQLQQLPEELQRFFQQDPRNAPSEPRSGRGVGSGFIVSEDGYVVTNAHVVEGASEMIVTLDDRHQYPATLVGLDEATDIALLKVDATGLPAAELGNSDDVKVGEWVLAIGSPFGLDHTATQGIVSAVARNLPSGGYAPFIQTDVAVNPGNSGGPLFNTEGVVIGVNSQIYSSSGGYQGLSFSIPINVAKHVVDQLKATGHASRGWLGVAIQDVDQGLADAFGLDSPTGALVSSLADAGPALAAGIQTGDIIVEFNGAPVNRSGDLPPLVALVAAGQNATVSVLRNGEPQEIEVKIGEFDSEQVASNAPASSAADQLGLVVGKLDEQMMQELGIDHGVRVMQVLPSGAAAKASIMTDDVILSLNGKAVSDPSEFVAQLGKLEAGKSVAALVMRGQNSRYMAIEIPDSHE
ncbi:Do family serine endopeptidase [Granulosicoccus antarcticus]|uniref:Probable periplasmic serine endoprotease DegP-like n=1 Tax=Granulosicoccus antarcticus IMCC3135 TaxID=1192854 RepID=A0A2Z2NYR9_9GAMM|nr:Do family serine endopeptidase [Granulosicoccus antarcticus]ASJ72284.1 Periplasmic pH-dependent serine endoprotease DegQ [Granulosicoccus antarcticus IMCC3135]